MMSHDVTTADLEAAYAYCEAIARRDKPHLYTAAQLFEHRATREAFAAAYASMRVIDDFVDEIPGRSNLGEQAREQAAGYVGNWLDHVRKAEAGQHDAGPVWHALSHTFQRFDLPVAPWEDLAHAMITDLHVPMFRDWEHLRHYMRGASVAPAVVFMHLVLVHPDADGWRFSCPWDHQRVAQVTEDLAIFCYWTHILRDAAIDLDAGGTGLIYFPRADLNMFQLSPNDLHEMKAAGLATDAYGRLAELEAGRARDHLARGKAYLPEILQSALPSHGRALTQLVNTYEAILARLAEIRYDVFAHPIHLSD
jgi:phytoene/squalene synthetase